MAGEAGDTQAQGWEGLLTRPLSRRRFVTLASVSIVAAAGAQALPRTAFASPEAGKIAIIHTNDVHCQLLADADKGSVGYAGVATLYKEAQARYGAANTVLVDAGDNLQGKVEGAVTDGAACVQVMNALGYSFAALGNHDFDFGMEVLEQRRAEANYELLSCNVFECASGTSLVTPYALATYAGKKLAFVGITTPETLTKSNPSIFRAADGSLLYDFKQDETGAAFYACVQDAVDAVRAAGADYVVALAHLGREGDERWLSDAVVKNTSGIDVMINGHSHQEYVVALKNSVGKEVIAIQAGLQLSAVGRIVIDTATNEISAELVGAPVTEDAAAKAVVDEVEGGISVQTGAVVGHAAAELVAVSDEGVLKVARLRETNLGDLAADAFRLRTGAAIGICNGGGLRSNLKSGDVTYGNVVSVMPFFNASAVVRVSGQAVLDALELGARLLPEPSGGFLQVSGMSYEIRRDIASTVELDALLNFVRVAGVRRVQNVRVGGEPIDPSRTYTVAGSCFQLLQGGDGYTMFQEGEAILSEGPVDSQLLLDYLRENLQGEIGAEYANRYGQGRIVIKDGPDDEGDPAVSSGEQELGGAMLGQTGDAWQAVTVAAAGAAAAATVAATLAAEKRA